MAEVTSYRQGTPSWLDLGTTDTSAARDFYRRLFDWEYEVGGAESGNYIQARLRGRAVAGMYELMPEMTAQGVRPNWTVYLDVEDADDVARRISDAGGTVRMGPMDVLDQGRLLVAADPTGATFGCWQARNHRGSGLVDEPGTLTWVELLTRDADRARQFFVDVFGYRVETMPTEDDDTPYTVFFLEDRGIAGLMAMPGEVPSEMPAHWMTYFAVDDVDAALDRGRQAGGQVVYGPVDMPSVGRFAGLQDPQGAHFAILKNAERQG
jgi:predicted enzyme related to lactoylglutathione lyase